MIAPSQQVRASAPGSASATAASSLIPALVAAAALAVLAGCDDTQRPVDPGPRVTSPAELVDALASAYETRDPEAVAAMLSDRADAPYLFAVRSDMTYELPVAFFDRSIEVAFHRRLLRPESVPPHETPVPEQLRVLAFDATFTPRGNWSERTDLYAAAGAHAGLDSTRWHAWGATYELRLLMDFPGETDHLAHATAALVVLEDRTLEPGARGKFLLYRWSDASPPRLAAPSGAGAAPGARGVATEPVTWTTLHVWFGPSLGVTSETMLMLEYQDAYQRRDSGKLASLVAQDATATFRFVLARPTPEGTTEWPASDEIHIHRRMFSPGYLPPGDPPVPPSLWLRALQAEFTPVASFAERTDLYASPPSQPEGLDPAVWRASAAVFDVRLQVALPAETQYLVSERVRCTVIENRAKRVGEAGKFLLYRMEELPEATAGSHSPAGVERISWGTLKSFYRPLRLDSEAGLVAMFLDAYRRRDTVAFDGVLAREASAAYRFSAPGRGPDGTDAAWDGAEESRLHRRMFNPDLRPPGETQVPWQLRLRSAEVYLYALDGWREHPEFYRSETNPEGLDPSRWRATGTSFTVNASFENVLLHVYRVVGEVDFVVIEDLSKTAGMAGKYLLHRWTDRTQLSNPAGDPPGTFTVSWTSFKRLYD